MASPAVLEKSASHPAVRDRRGQPCHRHKEARKEGRKEGKNDISRPGDRRVDTKTEKNAPRPIISTRQPASREIVPHCLVWKKNAPASPAAHKRRRTRAACCKRTLLYLCHTVVVDLHTYVHTSMLRKRGETRTFPRATKKQTVVSVRIKNKTLPSHTTINLAPQGAAKYVSHSVGGLYMWA